MLLLARPASRTRAELFARIGCQASPTRRHHHRGQHTLTCCQHHSRRGRQSIHPAPSAELLHKHKGGCVAAGRRGVTAVDGGRQAWVAGGGPAGIVADGQGPGTSPGLPAPTLQLPLLRHASSAAPAPHTTWSPVPLPPGSPRQDAAHDESFLEADQQAPHSGRARLCYVGGCCVHGKADAHPIQQPPRHHCGQARRQGHHQRGSACGGGDGREAVARQGTGMGVRQRGPAAKQQQPRVNLLHFCTKRGTRGTRRSGHIRIGACTPRTVQRRRSQQLPAPP